MTGHSASRMDASRTGEVPLSRKTGYAAGQLVEVVVTSMLKVFLLFYVTAVCGMPGWLAGIAIGAGLVVDAVMEPLIGSLSDGWRSRFGRRVPFMIAGLLPMLVTFNLIFALPSTLGDYALFAWLMLLSVSLRIAMSVYSLPYQALGVELSDDYTERSSIAAWRFGIGIMGTVAVIGLGYGLFLSGQNGVARRAAYLPLALTLSVLIVVGAVIAIRVAFAIRHTQIEAPAPTAALHSRLFGEVKEVFRNRTFVILFAASLLFNIGEGVHQALALHLGTFFWKLQSAQLQALSLAAVVGLVLGAPLASPLTARLEKRTMLILGKSGMVLTASGPVALRLLGLLPLEGSPLIVFLAATIFLQGVSIALTVIAFLAIVADAADEHEHLFGTRREGLYFAGWSFAGKSATGAGVLIAGLILQVIGFPSKLAEQGAAAAARLPEGTITWLAIAAGPGTGLLSAIAILLVWGYRLDRRTHAGIMTDLTARRAAAASLLATALP